MTTTSAVKSTAAKTAKAVKPVVTPATVEESPSINAIVAQWELIQRDVSKHIGLMNKQHELVRTHRTRAVRVFADLCKHESMQHRGAPNKSKIANLLGIERPTAYPYFEAVELVAHMVELKAFTLEDTPCEAEVIAANRPWDDAKALKREKRANENAAMGDDTGAGTSTKDQRDTTGEGTSRSITPQLGELSFEDILTKAKELHTTVSMAVASELNITSAEDERLSALMGEVMALVASMTA